MIFFISKYLSVLLAGFTITFIVYILLVRIQSIKAIQKLGKSKENNRVDLSLAKNALKNLEQNPGSAASKKIIFWGSFFVFLVFLALIRKPLFAMIFSIGAFFGIPAYYNKQIKRKLEVFENQLVEALGMITNSVRAGQSLQQALENMVKDTKPPISIEFETALRQTKLGTPLSNALLDITERVHSKDLKITVTSINLARETGGNMGEILTRLANTMKERKKIQGKITALTAQGKVSGIVMGCVPFLLLTILYFIEPTMMSLLFTTVLGNVMLFMAIIMVALGMFFIQKIVNIDI